MNDEQYFLYQELNKFFCSDNKVFLITGKPGSGKTTTIANYFKINNSFQNKKIIFLTPTHKAKQVLNKKLNKQFECITIAKYLNYIPDIDAYGNKKYCFKNIDINDDKNNILIIDECSMINKNQYKILMSLKCKYIIFIGDPNQLPPINEKISPCFSILDKYHLQNNYRSNKEILDICNTLLHTKKINIKENNSVKILNSDKYLKKLKKNKIEDYIDKKILCWTNKTCKIMNNIVRRISYGTDFKRFCDNELLIAKERFKNNHTFFMNNQEIIIKSIDKENVDLKDFVPISFLSNINNTQVKIWKLFYKLDNHLSVIYQKHQHILDKILSNIENSANNLLRNNNKKEAKKIWRLYYKIKDKFTPPIDYNYAITVHRSQGSEWNTVYIEYDDIIKNINSIERIKLLYVALSRAQNKIYIHSSD